MTPTLLIFIKNSVPGKVKTRLAQRIGPDQALEVYEKLLAHTRQVTAPLACQKKVCYSDTIAEDHWDTSIFEKAVQHGHDLGQRMSHAFAEAFEKGSTSVVIIGSDCPDLTTGLLETAFHLLHTHDYVIGPALDGGYYLLGMRTFLPQLFEDKDWSTATVLPDTLETIRQAGKTLAQLPVLTDIDVEADLRPYPWLYP